LGTRLKLQPTCWTSYSHHLLSTKQDGEQANLHKFSKFFSGQLGNSLLSIGFLTSDNLIGYSTINAVILFLCSDSNIFGYHHAIFYYCTQGCLTELLYQCSFIFFTAHGSQPISHHFGHLPVKIFPRLHDTHFIMFFLPSPSDRLACFLAHSNWIAALVTECLIQSFTSTSTTLQLYRGSHLLSSGHAPHYCFHITFIILAKSLPWHFYSLILANYI